MAQSAQPDGADARDAAELRQMMRAKMAEMTAEEDVLTQTDNTLLKDKVHQLNRLYEKSKEGIASSVARNAALDSAAMVRASDIGVKQSNNLNKKTSREFLIGLKRKFGVIQDESTQATQLDEVDDIQLDWDAFGRFAAGLFKRPPTWENAWDATLFEHEEKARQKQQRRTKGPIEEAVRPEEQTKDQVNQQEDQTQTRRTMALRAAIDEAHMQRTRQLGVPPTTPTINFFHLVLNKDSYSQTIENIFDVSFLVKDGVLVVKMDESGEPMLAPCPPPTKDSYEQGLRKVQNIIRIDYPTYTELCQKYAADLTESRRLLKSRPARQAQGGDARGEAAQS